MEPQDQNNPQNGMQPGGQPPNPNPSQPVITPQQQPGMTGQPAAPAPVDPTSMPYSNSTMQPSNGSNKKKLIAIVVGVAILLIALTIAGLVLLGGSDSDSTNSESTNDGESTTSSQQALENQDISAGLNEKVTLSNGVSLTVTGIERNWKATKPGRTAPTAKAGTSHVGVSLTIENNSAEAMRFGGTDFTLFDENGEDYFEGTPSYQADDEVLTLGEIPAGGSKTGQIFYTSVPNDVELSFVYEEGYINYATSEKINLKATFK